MYADPSMVLYVVVRYLFSCLGGVELNYCFACLPAACLLVLCWLQLCCSSSPAALCSIRCCDISNQPGLTAGALVSHVGCISISLLIFHVRLYSCRLGMTLPSVGAIRTCHSLVTVHISDAALRRAALRQRRAVVPRTAGFASRQPPYQLRGIQQTTYHGVARGTRHGADSSTRCQR